MKQILRKTAQGAFEVLGFLLVIVLFVGLGVLTFWLLTVGWFGWLVLFLLVSFGVGMCSDDD